MVINSIIAGLRIGDPHPVRIMGVLNLGPDSFYKGSIVQNVESAVTRAKQMVEDGADLLDLGAMSTAPGVNEISNDEERSRLIPILEAVRSAVSVPISVDTYRADVARAALDAGANIINDVSAFTKDKGMVEVLNEHNTPSVIMATNAMIGDPLTVSDIIACLKDSINLAKNQGYSKDNIIIDPAIGRWVPEKTYQYNLDIIKNINALTVLGLPILVGISRKSFIHEILNRPAPNDRLPGSLCATAIAVYNGAHIVRTHDVLATSDVVRIAKIIRDSSLSE